MAVVVRSLWLSDRMSARLLEQVAKELRYTQARRAQARKSHTKATRRKLRAAGVRLTRVTRCRWKTDRGCSTNRAGDPVRGATGRGDLAELRPERAGEHAVGNLAEHERGQRHNSLWGVEEGH